VKAASSGRNSSCQSEARIRIPVPAAGGLAANITKV
jgi:hypothetical protein